MESVSFKLEVFEGPLDLLLHLISKNKINIYDIPIAEILEQYMVHIEEMKKMDMELTSEFLAMASYLLYIKSKMLLPKHEDEEEEKDPREELVARLVEYQKYKNVLPRFKELFEEGKTTFVKDADDIIFDPIYKKNHTLDELYGAYNSVLLRAKRRIPPSVSSFTKVVGRKIVSVNSKIVFILKNLLRKKENSFKAIICKSKSKSEVVATFLAFLELIKADRIKVSDNGKNDYKVSLNRQASSGEE